MAWSTRELADLAGTTSRTVRHYHDVGLLEEPRRRANGYKQYGVAHLVRTLRIKRLADLGFTLPQIAELGDADQHPREALCTLDCHLAQDLDRLLRARVEVRQILRQSTPTDLPPALAARIRDADLSDTDRTLLIVLTRVLDLAVVIDFVDALRANPPSPAATAFDQLPADADDVTRQALAIRLLPRSRTLRVMLPRLRTATAGMSAAATRTLDEAVRDLYNPAQSDVLRRVGLLLRSRPDPVRTPPVPITSGRDRVPAAPARTTNAIPPSGRHCWEHPGDDPSGAASSRSAASGSPPGSSETSRDAGIRAGAGRGGWSGTGPVPTRRASATSSGLSCPAPHTAGLAV